MTEDNGGNKNVKPPTKVNVGAGIMRSCFNALNEILNELDKTNNGVNYSMIGNNQVNNDSRQEDPKKVFSLAGYEEVLVANNCGVHSENDNVVKMKNNKGVMEKNYPNQANAQSNKS